MDQVECDMFSQTLLSNVKHTNKHFGKLEPVLNFTKHNAVVKFKIEVVLDG